MKKRDYQDIIDLETSMLIGVGLAAILFLFKHAIKMLSIWWS